MNTENSSIKKTQSKEKLKSFAKALSLGILEGCLSVGLGWGLLKINIYAIFGIFIVWLVFGWFSTFIIEIKALEILTLIISASIVSGLIYYLTNLEIWLISLLVGLAIFFWSISFTSKIFLYPQEKMNNDVTENDN